MMSSRTGTSAMSIWMVPPLRPFPQHGMSSFGRGREHQFILASSGPPAKPTVFAHLQLSQPQSHTPAPIGVAHGLGGRAGGEHLMVGGERRTL